MWYNCPKCGITLDFDFDENTIPVEDGVPTTFDDVETHHIIKGEMWCPKCKKRYLFEEHWRITLENFKTIEIEY